MRGYVSSQIALFKNSKKIALSYNNEFSLSFEEFNIRMEYLKSFLDEISLPLGTRIGIIGLDLSYLYPYAIAVLDSYTLVLFENQSSVLKDFKEYEIDYILTEETNTDVRDFAFQNLTAVLTHNHGVFNKIGNSLFNHISSANVYGIVPTSGTTSKPKLIAKLHDNLISICQMHKSLYQYHETTVHLQLSPIERITTLNYSIYILINGSTSIINKLDFNTFFKTINYKSVTIFKTVPSVLRKIVDYLESSGNKISFKSNTLRYISVGGARLDHDLYMKASELFHTDIVQTYGSNETGTIASTYNLTKGYKQNSVGFVRYHEIKFIDDEICVKGNSVFEGYINYPNEDLFVDGWFKTGDIGYLDKDNYLFISGRKKEMINRGGEKVSPYEIEDRVLALGKYEECAAFAYPGELGIEEVGLVVVYKNGFDKENLSEVRQQLSLSISSYKLPTRLIVVQSILKTENGKIQRKNLYDFYKDHIEPKNIITQSSEVTVEDIVSNIWSRVLEVDKISLNASFIAMGGDSLKLAEVYAQVCDRLNIEVELFEFAKHISIKSLSEFLRETQRQRRDYKYIQTLRFHDGIQEPLIFIHNPYGTALSYQHIASNMKSNRSLYGLTFNPHESPYPWDLDIILDTYVDEINSVSSQGRIYLAGDSLGGKIAIELASRLQERGRVIGLIFLMDTRFYPTKKSRVFRFPNISIKLILQNLRQEIKGLSTFKVIYIFFQRIVNYFIHIIHLNKKAKNTFSVTENINEYLDHLDAFTLSDLIRKLFNISIRSRYPFKIVYLNAIKAQSEQHINLIKEKVDELVQEDINCKHGEFLFKFSKETASILDRHLDNV